MFGGIVLSMGCDNTSAPTYHKDIAPIMEASCVPCHQDGGIGPFALETYADTYNWRAWSAGAVASGSMPPWHAVPGHRNYQDNPSLTAAQVALIEEWAYGEALEGIQQEPVPTRSFSLQSPDLVLQMTEAYRPGIAPDDYRCFVIPWPENEPSYVTAFEVIPGAPELVHHAIAYLTYPEGSSRATALDEAEDGPGYTCFGGPGKIAEQDYEYGSLGGWAPGTRPKHYPEGTGILVQPGASIVLQVHYFVPQGNTTADRTSLALHLTETVETPGTYMAWLNGLWVLPGAMQIPANTWTRQWIEGNPYLYWPSFRNSPVDGEEPFRIHSAMLHMHNRGVSSSTWVRHPDGSKETLVEIQDWDFEWQREYYFEESVLFSPGDHLGLDCWFDNTADSPAINAGIIDEPTATEWGEGSADEMCVAFYYTTAE